MTPASSNRSLRPTTSTLSPAPLLPPSLPFPTMDRNAKQGATRTVFPCLRQRGLQGVTKSGFPCLRQRGLQSATTSGSPCLKQQELSDRGGSGEPPNPDFPASDRGSYTTHLAFPASLMPLGHLLPTCAAAAGTPVTPRGEAHRPGMDSLAASGP